MIDTNTCLHQEKYTRASLLHLTKAGQITGITPVWNVVHVTISKIDLW
jgi:hypothetical protein